MRIQTQELNPDTFFPKYSDKRDKGVVFFSRNQNPLMKPGQEIDFDKVDFLPPGHEQKTTREQLSFLQSTGCILHDSTVFMGLLADYKKRGKESVLDWLFAQKNVIHLDFFGDVFATPAGDLFVPCLYRAVSTEAWYWGYAWFACKYISEWTVKNKMTPVFKKIFT